MEDRAVKEGLWLVAGSALLGFFFEGAGTAVLAGIVALICVGRGSRWVQLQAQEDAALSTRNGGAR
jgi:hypothetical protein